MGKIPVYIVNEDQKTILTLSKVISKVMPTADIYTAHAGDEAWKILREENHVAIIIASVKLQGVNGWDLLKKIREKDAIKESYVFFVTSAVENNKNIKALQNGLDDFLKLPFSLDQLMAKLRSAERIVNMKINIGSNENQIEELNKELVETHESMVAQLIEIIDQKLPEHVSKALRIQEAAIWIATKLGDFEENEIKIIGKAARLCFAGLLYLPDNMIKTPVLKNGFATNETMRAVPANAKKLIARLKDYDDVQYIVYHLYENFDGTGIPDSKKAWQIPIGSRIIRVAMDYEQLLEENMNIEGKALDALYHENHRLYDFKIVALFDQYIAAKFHAQEEITIRVNEITEGHILSRNLTTESGLRLLSAGIVLNTEHIEKIREIKKKDPIIGDIYRRNR